MDENGITTPQMPEMPMPEMPMPPAPEVTAADMPQFGATAASAAGPADMQPSSFVEQPLQDDGLQSSPAAPVAPEPVSAASTPEPTPVVTSVAPAPEPAKSAEKKPSKVNSFLDRLKKIDWKNLDVKTLFVNKKDVEPVSGTATKFEINLVPSVKAEAIRALKMRNLVLFICIVTVSIAAGIVAILGSIVAGQNITMASQDGKLDTMSSKINSFEGLSEYLTIQDQLGNISAIQDNRTVLSRVFSFFNTILPTGADKITLSELSINLQDSTMTFTGQADAGVDPFIDYRVLESFKKSAALVKYDYGQYVDAEDNEIPTRCMIEANTDGVTFKEDNSVYAYWLKGKTGCEKAITERDLELAELIEENNQAEDDEKKSDEELLKDEQEIYEKYDDQITKTWYDYWLEENSLHRYDDKDLTTEERKSIDKAYDDWYKDLSDEEKAIVQIELDSGVSRKDLSFEKVYRTPQFSKWYRKEYMDTSGNISGIAHFNSQCITYTGTELDDTIRWTSSNECTLLDGDVEISNSSNGRDASDNLVLRFEASAKFNEEALKFTNKNVMAIGPNGRDVTDSYVQIEGMFQEEAKDCNSNDVVCTSNKVNETGEGSDAE